MSKYFWFDLDGTLRRAKDGSVFIDSPDNQEAIPGTQEAVKYFAEIGFKIVGISNQGGCAAIDPATGHPRKSLDNAIIEQQVTLGFFPKMEKILFCPTFEKPSYCYEVTTESAVLVQAPVGNLGSQISCLKPSHGMILASVRDEAEVDWDSSWMVGNKVDDQMCAARAIVNFIWTDVFLSYFGGEAVELPRQETKMIRQFEKLIRVDF